MKHKNCNKLLIVNIMIPIIVGAIIYYLLSPDVIFVTYINSIFSMDFYSNIHIHQNGFIVFIRNYVLDMLWGYSLIFSLFYIYGNNTAKLYRILMIGWTFSALIEILQLTPIVKGTFDICDIVVELLSELFAVFIIKKIICVEEFKR
ncbi:MAG: hypothetical protein GX567_16215 [Clostridia bacterium]|nr:hypothetical protein [Clostridia bacterium]